MARKRVWPVDGIAVQIWIVKAQKTGSLLIDEIELGDAVALLQFGKKQLTVLQQFFSVARLPEPLELRVPKTDTPMTIRKTRPMVKRMRCLNLSSLCVIFRS